MQLIKASRDAILKPLSTCANIVERRHTLPILANVLLNKTKTGLNFLATDLEIQISAQTPSESVDELSTTVAARKLLDIIKALPEGHEVSLSLDEKRLIVQSGKAKFTVQTLDASDFPAMVTAEAWQAQWDMPQKTLKTLLNQVSFAMAQQDIRYYLNGLLLVVEENTLRAVSTDGHRLAYCETKIDSNISKQEIIIPRKTIMEIMRQLDDSEAIVNIKLNAQLIEFTYSGNTLLSKLIEGKFPDFNKVIPKAHPKSINLNRVHFQSALNKAAILTSDKFKGVKLAFEADKMIVSANNSDQEEASDEMDIVYAHESMDIGFNVLYLQDVLSNLKNEEITIQLNDTNASALITVAGDETFKYVVMPMRI